MRACGRADRCASVLPGCGVGLGFGLVWGFVTFPLPGLVTFSICAAATSEHKAHSWNNRNLVFINFSKITRLLRPQRNGFQRFPQGLDSNSLRVICFLCLNCYLCGCAKGTPHDGTTHRTRRHRTPPTCPGTHAALRSRQAPVGHLRAFIRHVFREPFIFIKFARKYITYIHTWNDYSKLKKV